MAAAHRSRLITAIVVSGLVTPLVSAPRVSAAADGPVVRTSAVAASVVAAGALAVADVVVVNEGAAASAPLTVSVDTPDGMSLIEAVDGSATGDWSCDPSARCTWVGASSGDPLALDAGALAAATFTFAVTTLPDGPVDVTFSSSVPSGPGAEPNLEAAAAVATFTRLPAGRTTSVLLDIDGGVVVTAGASEQLTVAVHNLGPGVLGGSSGRVELAGVLPTEVTDWAGAGDGWTCDPDLEPGACEWSGPEVAVGEPLPELTVDFIAPATPTPANTSLPLTRVATLLTPEAGAEELGRSADTMAVIAPAALDATLAAATVGSAVVERGGTGVVSLQVTTNDRGEGAPVQVAATLPSGVTYVGPARGADWECTRAAQRLTCAHPGPGAEAAARQVEVTLSFGAGMASGPVPISFVAAIEGEAAESQADNTSTVSFEVLASSASSLDISVLGYPGGVRTALSGGPLTVARYGTTRVAVDAAVVGVGALPVGSTVTMRLRVPSGFRAALSDAGQWSCATPRRSPANSLTCSLRVSSAIAAGAALPPLELSLVRLAGRTTAGAVGSLGIAAAVGGSSSSFTNPPTQNVPLAWAAADTAPSLVLSLGSPASVRAGGTAIVSASLSNTTDQPLPGSYITLALPAGLAPAGDLPDGCSMRVNVVGRIVCASAATIPAGEEVTVELPVTASESAVGQTVRVYAIIGRAARRVIPERRSTPVVVDLAVTPALRAIATASPSELFELPAGEPQPVVLLDGSASEATGATLTWIQVPEDGEPAVTFDGLAAGEPANAPSVTFAIPDVDAPTTLHFQLTVSDGESSAVTSVTVRVSPAPSALGELGGDDGSGSSATLAAAPGRTSMRLEPHVRRLMEELPPGEGWVRAGPPTVVNNRLSDVSAPGVVWNSYITVVAEPGWVWQGNPDAVITDQIVWFEWVKCLPFDGCSLLQSDLNPAMPQYYLPYESLSFYPGTTVTLRTNIAANVDGNWETESFEYQLGELTSRSGTTPIVIEAPRIEGVPAVGSALSADVGEYSLTFPTAVEWYRCTGPAGDPITTDHDEPAGCTLIDTGSQGLPSEFDGGVAPNPASAAPNPLENGTYTPSEDDAGFYLRLQVRQNVGEGRVNTFWSRTSAQVEGETVQPLTIAPDLSQGTSFVNGTSIEIPSIVGGGKAPITVVWQQTGGSIVLTDPQEGMTLPLTLPAEGSGTLSFTVTATDSLGTSVVAPFDLTHDPGVSSSLCDLLLIARSAASSLVTYALGDLELELDPSQAVASSGPCGAATSITFAGVTVNLFGWFEVRNVDIAIDANGIVGSGGAMIAPDDELFAAMEFRVVGEMNIPFGGDGAPAVSVTALADSLPFMPLPSGWAGASSITFAAEGDEQTLSFDGIAWDTSAGEAATSFNELPVPPDEAPTITVAGAGQLDRTFELTFAATSLLSFTGVDVDFTGTVTREEPDGEVVVTGAATLAAPVALAEGFTLNEAELAWDGEQFTGQGVVEMEVEQGSLLLVASLAITDAEHFSIGVSLSPGSGQPTWELGRGVELINPAVSGSIVRDGDETAIDVELSAETMPIVSGVVARDISAGLTITCTLADCDPVLELAGTLDVMLGSASPVTATFTGTFGLLSGEFDLMATLSNLTPIDGVVVSSIAVSVTGGAELPITVTMEGTATVLDVSAAATIEIREGDGWLLDVSLGNWTPVPGAPTFRSAHVLYSSVAIDHEINGEEVQLPAGVVMFAAVSTVPTWFSDLIDVEVGDVAVWGSLRPETGDFDVSLSVELPGRPTLFAAGGVTLRLERAGFRIVRTGSVFTAGIEADGELSLPSLYGGPGAVLPVTVAAAVSPTPFVLSATITVDGEWRDAFGIPGVHVTDLTVQLSMGAGTGSFAFAGSVVLPAEFTTGLGVVAGTPVKLAASVGTANPCFAMQIGQPTSTTTVVDIGRAGVVTATYVSLVVAPQGCTIGSTVMTPGLNIVFNGRVLGVDVLVKGALNVVPLRINLTALVGPVDVSGIRLNWAAVNVRWSPTEQSASFSGSLRVFGTDQALSGSFSRTATTSQATLSARLSGLSFGGFQVGSLTLTGVVATHLTTGVTTLEVGADAAMEFLGEPQTVRGEFGVTNGQLTSLSGDFTVNLSRGGIGLVGTADVELRVGQFPRIEFSGAAALRGFVVGAVTARLYPGSLSFTGILDWPGFPGSPPSIGGEIAWPSVSGIELKIYNENYTLVNASPLDFRLDGEAALNVAGYSMDAKVKVSYLAPAALRATVTSQLYLGMGWVSLSGVLDTGAGLSMAGAATLRVGSVDLANTTVTVSSTNVRVAGSIFVVGAGTVLVSGDFSWNPTLGALFELRGTTGVSLAAIRLAAVEVTAFRRADRSTGVTARGQLDTAGLASATVDLALTSSGQWTMTTDVALAGVVGRALGSPVARVVYSTASGRLTFTARLGAVLAVPVGGFVSGELSSSGISAAVRFDLAEWRDSINLGVCTAWYYVGFSVNGTVSGGVDSPSINLGGAANVAAGCGDFGLNLGVGIDIGYTAPTSARLRVSLAMDFGVRTWNPTVYSAAI